MNHRPLVTLAFFLFAAAPAAWSADVAASPQSAAVAAALAQRELEVELSCDPHFRARPCREADGSTGLHCVIRSPLAAVLHWLDHDEARADDEVRREREVRAARQVREPAAATSPDGVPEPGEAAPARGAEGESEAIAAASPDPRRIVVRRAGDMQECRRP